MQRLLITPGEPAGIGPDITVQIAQQDWNAELIAIADPDLLQARAQLLGLPLQIMPCTRDQLAATQSKKLAHRAGTLKVIPVSLATSCTPGKLDAENAAYVLETLELAGHLCLQKLADAVVTGPVHKGIINQAGMHFTGHTEFFAHLSHVKHTVMLFVVGDMKVALATTHLPLAKVPAAITQEQLRLTLTILNDELKHKFHIAKPRILICGLNPHAGEGGYLGREEIDTMIPLISQLQAEGYQLVGPLPADTIFTPRFVGEADAILAMYHDQALPLVKYIGFGHAVNVTLGIPFIRTSVDHGTALDVAGTTDADPGSLQAALAMAITLSGEK